ncbi:hypothetical protein V6N13_141469 [Hibiscus sabdariffa]
MSFGFRRYFSLHATGTSDPFRAVKIGAIIGLPWAGKNLGNLGVKNKIIRHTVDRYDLEKMPQTKTCFKDMDDYTRECFAYMEGNLQGYTVERIRSKDNKKADSVAKSTLDILANPADEDEILRKLEADLKPCYRDEECCMVVEIGVDLKTK